MEVKKQTAFRLSNESKNYIMEVAKEKSLNLTQALELIINDHREYNNDYMGTLSDNIIRKFDDKYKDTLTHIQFGCNSADKNTQIIIEILNSICIDSGLQEGISTDTLKSSVIAVKQL